MMMIMEARLQTRAQPGEMVMLMELVTAAIWASFSQLSSSGTCKTALCDRAPGAGSVGKKDNDDDGRFGLPSSPTFSQLSSSGTCKNALCERAPGAGSVGKKDDDGRGGPVANSGKTGRDKETGNTSAANSGKTECGDDDDKGRARRKQRRKSKVKRHRRLK
jgi:hypothetical protein